MHPELAQRGFRWPLGPRGGRKNKRKAHSLLYCADKVLVGGGGGEGAAIEDLRGGTADRVRIK